VISSLEDKLLSSETISLDDLSNFMGISKKTLQINLSIAGDEISAEQLKTKTSELLDQVFESKTK
jgi:hypothetical protein